MGSVANPGDLNPSYTGNIGDGYIVDSNGDLYVWDGAVWINVGQIVGPEGPTGAIGPQGDVGPTGPAASGVYNKFEFIATANQSTFVATYVPGFVDVYQNGAKLLPSEYTATSGTSIVLAVGANEGESIEVIAWEIASVSNLTGPQGPTGVGATGPAGADSTVPGPTGPAGAGSTGPTGPGGSIGTQGDPGPMGPTGETGPTGAAGIDGATGPQGVAGAGLTVYSFDVAFNSSGQVNTISNLPSGWSTTNTATTIAVTHTVGTNPFMASVHGTATAGGTKINIKIGTGSGTAGSFQMDYQSTGNTVFNITSITTANFGTVTNGTATVYVYFL